MSSENEGWSRWRYGPPLGPIVGTFAALIGWLVFIILYALFWSNGYNLFQNVIVTFATLLIVALMIGLIWIAWGRTRGPMRKWGHEHDQTSSESKPPETKPPESTPTDK